jgi:SPP1 gp7 family putative phage head morphogenesis protein
VVAYLAQVENRMRRVDDEVYTRVAATVAQGTQEGWSIPQTAEALSELLDQDNPLWRNKAARVARTETIGALNAGRTDSFNAIAQEVPELNFQQQWLATDDNRTRPTHQAADGQRVPIGSRFQVGSSELRFPGDPLGPADETIQCRCTTILVEEGREVDFSNRGFRGIL